MNFGYSESNVFVSSTQVMYLFNYFIFHLFAFYAEIILVSSLSLFF